MSRLAALTRWTATVSTQLPQLSRPQAAVLAAWKPHWRALLQELQDVLPASWTVGAVGRGMGQKRRDR